MHIGVQPFADPSSQASLQVFNVCAQAYHPRVKEGFPNPNSEDPTGHSPEPGDEVLWKHHPMKTPLKPC